MGVDVIGADQTEFPDGPYGEGGNGGKAEGTLSPSGHGAGPGKQRVAPDRVSCNPNVTRPRPRRDDMNLMPGSG